MERDRIKNMATTIFLTVLLTIALQVNGFDYDDDYFDMDYAFHGTVCPIGTVFCLKTLKCVNSETPHTDPCPLSPNCKKNEVKLKPFGYEVCENFKTACGGGMNICKRDGELQCDHFGSCDRVEAFLSLQTSFDSFVDTYDSAVERTVSQFAAAVGVSEDDVWTADITWDNNGNSFTNLRSFLSPNSNSMLNDFFSRQDEVIFTDANNTPVSIDWTMSWMKYHPANEYDNDDDYSYDYDYPECIHCGPNEVFCLETMSCRKVDGSCPVIEDCDVGLEKCFQMDGSYECLLPEQCYYDEDDDYSYDYDYPECIHCGPNEVFCLETMSCRKTDGSCPVIEDCGAGLEKCFQMDGSYECLLPEQCNYDEDDDYSYDYDYPECIHCGPNEVFCLETMSCRKVDGSCPVIEDCDVGLEKCFQIDGSYECLLPEQCNNDEDDDYSYDYDYPECIHCGPNEVFCLETMSCRKTDGSCPVIEGCDEGWNKCLQMDGLYHCVPTDQCSQVQVIIALRIDDFGTFVGENYMHYYQQLGALTNSLVPESDPHYGMIWNASIWHENDTLVWFHCWIAEELYDTVSSSLSFNTLNLYDMYGMGLSIDWYQSHVYYHQETPNECEHYQQKCFQDGFMQCVDTNTCRHVEVYFELGIDSTILSQMFGADYHDVLVTTFIQLFSQNMAEVYDDNMFWNISIYEEYGKTKVHFWAAGELFQVLSDIKTNEGNGILSDDISQLLDWTSFAVWFDGETDNENDGYEEYDDIVCGPAEVFCLETKSCFTPDASCDTDDECGDNMEICHDGDDQICVPEGTCETIVSILSRFTFGLPEDDTISIEDIVQNRELIKQFLKSKFEIEVGTGNLQTIALYPTALNSNHVNVYAEFTNTDQQNLESLTETFSLSIGGISISILDATFMPLVDLYQNIYVLSVPVVANVSRLFSIEQVMPVDALANAASTATFDCSETSGVQVSTENNPLSAIIDDVSMTDTISLEHSLTESMFVKCRLFNDQGEYYVGFLAIPEDITLMGEFEDISTTQESLDIDEDSDWMHLPQDMFQVSMKGEGLYQMLNTWGEMMTSNHENWINYGTGISMLTVFEDYAIDLFDYMSTNIESFSATVTTDLTSAQAKFRYRDEPMDGNAQIHILKYSSRVSMLLEENYYGQFNIIINSDATGINLALPVNVLGSPDSPALYTDFSFEGYSQFAYPLNAQDAVFIVEDVASIPFYDVDGDDLGLLVVGYVNDSFTVDGIWEYSDDDGFSWTEIDEAMVPDGDTGIVTALRLEANDLLRFTPGPTVTSWSLVAAPSLAVYAFDGTDEITDLNDDITISKCSSFGGDKINQYCMVDRKASYSEDLAVIPLAKYDCNNDLTDGTQELACGCGDSTSCLDCHGIVNGGAVVDICGVCNGGLSIVNCSHNACLENRKTICDHITDEVGDVEDPVCGADLIHKCGECLEVGDPTLDACGVECGSNSCLDCANVENGTSVIDTCGYCSTPAEYNVGCAGIGNIQPEFVFYDEADTIIFTVSHPDSLNVISNAQNTSCVLESEAPGIAVDLTVLYLDELFVDTYQITVTLNYDEPKSTLIGKYFVSCQFDDVDITSWPQNFTIFGFPTVQSVTPTSYEYQEIHYDSYAVIRGEGFIDTGDISLVVPCSEVKDDCGTNAYVGAEGIYINETAIGAPLGKLKQSQKLRGQIYHVSVLLYDWRQYDLPSDVVLSSVEFEVKVPAPEVISAKKSKYGCTKIVLSFNMRVVVETNEPTKCNTFLQDFEDDALCTMQPYGDSSIVIEYSQDISAWTDITVIDNRIKNADDYSNSPRYFTGSVGITTDGLDDSEQPIVGIDGVTSTSVGCKGTVLKPTFKNLRCFQPVISWSVTSDSSDPTETDGLITNPDKKVQKIFPTQLSDGITYELTMTYSVGPVSGSKSITLVKSSDATPTLEILDVKDGFVTTRNNAVKADIKLCGDNLSSNVEVGWTVKTTSGEEVLLGKGKVFNIKKDKLDPEYQYTITATLFYDGVTVNVDKTFTTASKPIVPIIKVNDAETLNIEADVTETLTLKCRDDNNDNFDPSKYTCAWTCKSNQQTTGLRSVANPDGTVWISFGEEITAPATLIEDIPEYDYILNYELNMYRGNESAQSTLSVTHRSAVVLELIQEPVIIVGVKDEHEITDNNFEKTLAVHCKKATRYSWTVNDGENDHGKPITVSAYLIGSVAAQAIVYDDTASVDCGIKLNFASLQMVPGTKYYIKLSVYNEQGSNVRTESHIFRFKRREMPVPGTLDLQYTDDPPIAMKTIFTLVMVGWSEEIVLKCFGYYKSVTHNEPYHRLNSIQVSPSAGIPTFSLPEGEFEFYVKCVDDYDNLISALSSFTVTVQSVPPSDIFTAVIGVLSVRVTIEIETVITTVSNALSLSNSVGQSAYSNNEMASANAILYESTNVAITTSIGNCYDDQVSLVVVLEQSVNLVIQAGPTIVSVSTRLTIVATASRIAHEAIGGGSFGRRRKREVNNQVASAEGLTQQEAIVLLQTFDAEATLSNDTLNATQAIYFRDAIDDIMVALCLGYNGVTSIEAPSNKSFISVYKTDMVGFDTNVYSISSDTVNSGTLPGKIVFGSEVTDRYGGVWECMTSISCNEVFVGVGIIKVDTYTPAAGIEAPTRISDIYIARILNPFLYGIENVDNLADPVVTTITIYEQVNETAYDYKCKMWLNDAWDESVCTTSTQAFDAETSNFYVVCSCTELGVLAIFQELKEIETLSLDSTSTSTTTTTTTTPLPSVNLQDWTTSLFMTFSFIENFFDFLTSDSATQAVFTLHIRDQLVSLTQYPPNSFQNWAVSNGSIVVSFELYQSGSSPTLGQMAYALEDLFSSGNITLTSPNGTTLTIIPGSFAYQEISNSGGATEESSESSNSAVVIGGAVAGVVIAILIAVIVVLVLKQKGIIKIGSSHGSVPNDPPPRYEMPSPNFNVMPARPPPYIYDPVKESKAQKWIENEVEKKVAEIKEQEEKRPISSSSGGTTATGLPTADGMEKKDVVPSVSP